MLSALTSENDPFITVWSINSIVYAAENAPFDSPKIRIFLMSAKFFAINFITIFRRKH